MKMKKVLALVLAFALTVTATIGNVFSNIKNRILLDTGSRSKNQHI